MDQSNTVEISEQERRRQKAFKRWRLFVDVVLGKRKAFDSQDETSVRRFSSFGLLKTDTAGADTNEPQHIWYHYTCPTLHENRMMIRHLDETVTLDDLLGFNNTGNVCVWPAEEVMTYYCLKNSDMFRDKSVCELGGGMTCLAGFAVAAFTEPHDILLTDGNERSTANLDVIASHNADLIYHTQVKSRVLRWDIHEDYRDLNEAFDIVIAADCLFFDEFRKDLVFTLTTLLKPNGIAVIFAPRRGTTLEDFVKLSSDVFKIEVIENYDETVWELHTENKARGIESYDANIHYPLLVKMVKQSAETIQ